MAKGPIYQKSISSDNDELVRLLVAIVKTSKESLSTNKCERP
jgi:hypothetical protein